MNQYNPNIHHRRSIRLKGYDYSQAGAYFITICCQDRMCLFGDVINGKMILNDAGKIAVQCWLDIPQHFPNVVLHEYVVMPNHIHGIIEIVVADNVGANTNSPNEANNNSPNETNNNSPNETNNNSPNETNNNSPNDAIPDDIWAENFSSRQPTRPNGTSKTIGSMVRGFKIGVTKWMRQNTNIYDVWQRDYYEHIIRDEKSYRRISDYIVANPAKWQGDKFYKKFNNTDIAGI